VHVNLFLGLMQIICRTY